MNSCRRLLIIQRQNFCYKRRKNNIALLLHYFQLSIYRKKKPRIYLRGEFVYNSHLQSLVANKMGFVQQQKHSHKRISLVQQANEYCCMKLHKSFLFFCSLCEPHIAVLSWRFRFLGLEEYLQLLYSIFFHPFYVYLV